MTRFGLVMIFLLMVYSSRCQIPEHIENYLKKFDDDVEVIFDRNQEPELTPIIGCEPEVIVVPLDYYSNYSMISYPKVIKAPRCTGYCAQDEVYSCQPTKIEIILYSVFHRRFIQYNKFTDPIEMIVPVEHHLACSCRCIIKKSDCTAVQIYNPDTCSCECENVADHERCLSDPTGNKMWHADTCSCQCVAKKECPTGYFFNRSTCRCTLERNKVKYGISNYAKGRTPHN